MSDKAIAGSGSLFCGLFGEQSEKEKEDYLRALEEAARWLAVWDDAEASDQKEKGWIN